MNNGSLSTFIIALIIYAFIANALDTKSAAGLSILLIMGALIVNSKNGKNFLNTIGVKS